ncbi:hypothetical protein [Ornithinimicrobium pekingense]|uniref:Uncharacterized protein n=1 Tax=Ornithinimicrobium pekingense TaxID=384677 RepID=A0ABQ2FDQ6_9MICO|nr:hypothetical protein [Ornithinimicrobium pekingense]GGK79355.1 hypothetical protein GCM10011509_29820 [Ornithinimicrobium pekingense]
MTNEADTLGSGAIDSSVELLVSSASRWMKRAMIAWAEDDAEGVGLLAPIAVEHLGKAALWQRNPALLVPLQSNAEIPLHILADRPRLTDPRLRTIGLGGVLDRIERCLDVFPLNKEQRKNLVDTRNGVVHVGARGASKEVLRDALRICSVILDDLAVETGSFFGDQHQNVVGLLEGQRSEVEGRVRARMANARNHLNDLEERLGRAVFEDTMAALEADAPYALDTGDVAIDHPCPECGSKGRLAGLLDAEPEVDWDVEKIGGGYEAFPAGAYWELRFSPQSFACNVCKLHLTNQAELAAALLPASRYELDARELDHDFDVDAHVRAYEAYD